MAKNNTAARFARTIRSLLDPPPAAPNFDKYYDPQIARIEWVIAPPKANSRCVSNAPL
jgi:hypothetical protein